MNTEEAMRALLNGEKITGATWSDTAYLTMLNGEIVNSNNYKSSLLPDVCWILYSEPKQKVKLYQWAKKTRDGGWIIVQSGGFFSVDFFKSPSRYVCLLHTMIEVDL